MEMHRRPSEKEHVQDQVSVLGCSSIGDLQENADIAYC